MFFRNFIYIVFISFVVFVVGCKSPTVPDANSDPNPLIGPGSVSIVQETSVVQTVQLFCSDNVDNLNLFDEDGDSVTVVVDSNTPLPSYMTLDETSGLLTIVNATGSNPTINFWTIDDNGGSTIETPLSVTMNLYANSNPNDITGPASINITVDPIVTTIYLETTDADDLLDPDGHVVEFEYILDTSGVGVTLDDIQIEFQIINGKGTVSVTHPRGVMDGNWADLTIWTEDAFGGSSSQVVDFYLFYGSS